MSLNLFKSNMKKYMASENSDVELPKKLTQEYDSAVKRGNELINTGIKLLKGNTSIMEAQIDIACKKALTVTETANSTFYNDIGKAIISYWQLSELNPFPLPLIPGGPGAIQNILITKAITTSPGTWKPGALFPSNNSDVFLDKLIMGIRSHLMTVGGTYYMMCLYPNIVPFTAPGILNWKGYSIPA